MFDEPLVDEPLVPVEPVDVPGDELPLVSVPGLLVPPLGEPVPMPLVSLPGVPGSPGVLDVPGVTVLSVSPAPVPFVPVWVGLVSIGGNDVGEFVGLALVPVESGVVSVPDVPVEPEVEPGVEPGRLVLPLIFVGALLPMPVPLLLPALEPDACATNRPNVYGARRPSRCPSFRVAICAGAVATA